MISYLNSVREDFLLGIIRRCIQEKEYSIEKLAKNLRLLYLFNLLDLFFTKTLLFLAPNMFIEANGFMAPIIDGFMPYILKIFVFAIVLLYWYKRSFSSNCRQLKLSINVSKICLIIYGLINIFHLIYIFMFLYIKF